MYHAFCILFFLIFGVTKPLKTHEAYRTFQKKYAFRCSVVTSMCAPPTRNHYFFCIFSNVPRVLHTFLSPKNLKKHRPPRFVPAKRPCKTCDTFNISKKKYAFRCSVVTSMCTPPTRNCNFFLFFSDVPRVLHTFLVL